MTKDLIFASLIVVILIGAVLVFGLNLTGDVTGYIFTDPDSEMEAFAKCLTGNGAVMYISKGCGSCNSQRLLFGGSFKHIENIDCTEEPGICAQNGIQRVPTWIISGVKYEGVQSLERLSEISGCQLNK